MTTLHLKGCSRVEANLRFARHQRIVDKPWILCRIFDHQHFLMQDGMATESGIATGLGSLESIARLEPLPFLIDKAH